MTKPLTDQDRALIVHQYLGSNLSQDEFCALKASEGIHLAPRTLRSWCTQVQRPRNPTEECVQIILEAVERLRGVLDRLQADRLPTSIGEGSHMAAGPASAPEAPKGAVSLAQTASAGALPTGRPDGNSHGTIEFMPTGEAPGAEHPTVRRKGGVIWSV
jgi:hypothetical protein